jgi:integrase
MYIAAIGKGHTTVQIQYQVNGIRFNICPGLTYDYKKGTGERYLKPAKQTELDKICARIKFDIEYSEHPETVAEARERYVTIAKKAKQRKATVKQLSDKAKFEIWCFFRDEQYKDGNIKEGTYKKDLAFRSKLEKEKFPWSKDWSLRYQWIDKLKGDNPYRYYKWLSQCWDWLIRQNLAEKNYVKPRLDFVSKPTPKKNKVFIPEEHYDLIYRDIHANCAQFFRFLYFSGLRPGEALGLKISEVNFEKNLMGIHRSSRATDSTKTGSERFWPLGMPNCIGREVRECLEGQILIVESYPEYVWPNIPNHDYFARQLECSCKRLGLPHYTPYNLRHSFSIIAKKEGLTQDQIALLMGNSPRMLAEHYQNKEELAGILNQST